MRPGRPTERIVGQYGLGQHVGSGGLPGSSSLEYKKPPTPAVTACDQNYVTEIRVSYTLVRRGELGSSHTPAHASGARVGASLGFGIGLRMPEVDSSDEEDAHRGWRAPAAAGVSARN